MSIEGTWYNELGSKMILGADGALLSGKYQSGVSTSGIFELTGMIDPAASASQSFGFVVAWNNGNQDLQSTTAWCGQLQTINGQETLTTMWLLTSQTDPSTNWESTLIGQDIFTRNPPSEERAVAARKKHPYRMG